MGVLVILKNEENNGTEEIGLVTHNPGLSRCLENKLKSIYTI